MGRIRGAIMLAIGLMTGIVGCLTMETGGCRSDSCRCRSGIWCKPECAIAVGTVRRLSDRWRSITCFVWLMFNYFTCSGITTPRAGTQTDYSAPS